MVSSRDLDPIWDLAFGRRVESAVGFRRNGGDFIRGADQHLWRDSNLQTWKVGMSAFIDHLYNIIVSGRSPFSFAVLYWL